MVQAFSNLKIPNTHNGNIDAISSNSKNRAFIECEEQINKNSKSSNIGQSKCNVDHSSYFKGGNSEVNGDIEGTDEDIYEDPNKINRKNSRNAECEQPSEDSGFNIITTVAEIHEPPERREKKYYSDLEKTDFESSFKFDPVLTSDTDGDDITENIESREINFHSENENVDPDSNASSPSHTDFDQNASSANCSDSFVHSENVTNLETIQKTTKNFQRNSVSYQVAGNSCQDHCAIKNCDSYSHATKPSVNDSNFKAGKNKCVVFADLPLYPPSRDGGGLRPYEDASSVIAPTQQFEVCSELWAADKHSEDCSRVRETNHENVRDLFIQKSQGFSPDVRVKFLCSDKSKKTVALLDGEDSLEKTQLLSNAEESIIKDQSSLCDSDDSLPSQSASYCHMEAHLGHSNRQTGNSVDDEPFANTWCVSGEIPATVGCHPGNQQSSKSTCENTDKEVSGDEESSAYQLDNQLQSHHHETVNFALAPPSLSANTSTEAVVGTSSPMTENNRYVSASNVSQNSKSLSLSDNISETSIINTGKVDKNPALSPEPDSPSLHFSLLTLPSIRDTESSQSAILNDTCPLFSLSTPVISSFSPLLQSKVIPLKRQRYQKQLPKGKSVLERILQSNTTHNCQTFLRR